MSRLKDELPGSFRRKTTDAIFQLLKAGESCSIIGIGSVGKSNLLRFLCQQDVQRLRLGKQWHRYLIVYLDSNKMLKHSQWGLFELMMHQLLKGLVTRDVDKALKQEIDDLHYRALESEDRPVALRYIDRALEIICRGLELRVTFLFDEFDHLCSELSPQTFAALRAMRDDYKYLLTYVVATRKELSILGPDSGEFESFEELVTPNSIWLVSYSAEDARLMVNRLASRYSMKLERGRTQEVIAWTGGHPGLIRVAFPLLANRSDQSMDIMLGESRIQAECQRIWRSLSFEEQKVLTSFANDREPAFSSKLTLDRLRQKGLVGGSWAGNSEVFSPLFAEFIRQEKPPVGSRLTIDEAKRVVVADDIAVQNLTPLEFQFLAYLAKRRGQVCSRDELALHLYPDDKSKDGVSDNRIDSIAKRLRSKIDLDTTKPALIETVRGIGFRLVDGEVAGA